MLKTIVVIAVVCCAAVLADQNDPLCKKFGAEHSSCLPTKACPKTTKPCGMNEAAKAEILKRINELRQRVANGEETRGYGGKAQPKATNLYEITWNDEFERTALAYVAKPTSHSHDCSYSLRDGHYINACRRTPTYNLVGQNAAASGYPDTTWTKAVDSWYGEVDAYVYPQEDSPDPSKIVGHYTQLVWATTHEVGCGAYTFDENCSWHGWNFPCTQYLCNFGPAGNMMGQAPYKTTGECAKKSTKYPGLCAV